jgi:small-conductance mechanosensitive channel
MENFIGGILLKCQDKFRYLEKISIPRQYLKNSDAKESEGIVQEITFLNTKLRLKDNSLIVVPNSVFIQGVYIF